MSINVVIGLAVLFQFKHFIADYLLQGKYMLGKFAPQGWQMPLAAHCGVHFVFTALIASFVCTSWYTVFALAGLDFAIHFIMDRIKAAPDMLGRFKALTGKEYVECDKLVNSMAPLHQVEAAQARIKGNTYFWWSLGFDQLVHHLTDLTVLYIMVTTWH